MAKTLCTFSGPFGDILWSLPTVKEISCTQQESVDFTVMPEYESLLNLLSWQPYINIASGSPHWKCTGAPHGNQPWQPPAEIEKGYEKVFHLTYRAHPGIGGKRLPLIQFIADQQGIKLRDNPIPFLATRVDFGYRYAKPYVALAFNSLYSESKLRFLEVLRKAKLKIILLDVNGYNWLDTATMIKHAMGFIGCRSSNWVIACGVGQKNIFTYEPHPSRNAQGQFGDVFGCPYVNEVTDGLNVSPEQAAEHCMEMIKQWERAMEKNSVETSNETINPIAGGVCG